MTVTNKGQPTSTSDFFPAEAEDLLKQLCMSLTFHMPNPKVASLEFIAGYIAHKVTKTLSGKGCIALVKPNGNAPANGLISHQTGEVFHT